MLGGYDQSLIEGGVNYHKVVDPYYWSMKADKILVGGKDVGVCNNCRVVADTGTSLITGPSDMLPKLLAAVETKNPCQNIDQLPPITFVMDGVHYTLNGSDYMMSVSEQGE